MKNFTLRAFILILPMTLYCLSAMSQSWQMTGEVRDASGPVIGANVVVKGTARGTTTNLEGRFSLQVSSGDVLTVTLLGYAAQEIAVTNQTRLEVVLEEESRAIDELVVIGYGTQRRVDVTGAVSTVDIDDMLITPSTNIAEMLRGRVAGVQVTSASGRPGSASTVMIRGRRSLKDDQNAPLYVVDGTTMDAAEFANINPNDVESISVLKDGASQAIYGARAANGVILVQTKRGKSGDGVVTFDAQLGVQTLWRNFDYYTAEEWYAMKAEGVANYRNVDVNTLTPEEVLGSREMIEAYENKNYTDWEKLMLKPAINQTYNIGFRGGTDRVRVGFGIGHFNQDGMLRTGSGYRRTNFRFSADYDVKKWITIGANMSYSTSKREIEDGKFETYVGAPPLAQPYNPDGSLREWMNSEDLNPMYLQAHSWGEETNVITRLSGYLELKPVKGLTYRLNGSLYSRYREENSYTDRHYTQVGSRAMQEHTKYPGLLIDNIVTYQFQFPSSCHALSLTGVASYDEKNQNPILISSQDIPVDRDWNMIADGQNYLIDTKPDVYDRNVVMALVARVNYSLYDRYLFQASICRNGSSRFGQNNKWATFPAVSVGWRISQESFMRDLSWITDMKLRYGYGWVGNQNGIDSFTTTPMADSYSTEFGDYPVMGYLPGSVLSNPFLMWETTKSHNIGLDLSLFNHRLTASLEYYRTKTHNLLVERFINSALGYASMWDNLGETQTNGFEVSLGYDIFRKRDFKWNVSANMGYSKNKIVRVDDRVDGNGNPLPHEANRWFPGYPIKVYYDYVFDGIYQLDDFNDLGNGQWEMLNDIDTDGDGYGDTYVIPYQSNPAPGMIRVKDLNGDGKITTEDRKIMSREPDYTASLISSVNWKNIDLTLDFYGIFGGLRRNPLLHETGNGTLRGRYTGIKMDYWTPENPSNRWPRPNAMQNPSLMGSAAIQKADYIRLRTVVLGYTLPSKLTSKVKIDKVRMNFTATNLWTKTEFLSYSPEFSANGYPEARQYMFGINVTF